MKRSARVPQEQRDVWTRYEAYMKMLVRGFARGRPDFQEDLLQEARMALLREMGGTEVLPNYCHVARAGMRTERRRQVKWWTRFESLDDLMDEQERQARAEECDVTEEWLEWGEGREAA
jgi:hypothetical protein